MAKINDLQGLYDFTVANFGGSPEQALKSILYHNLDGYEQIKENVKIEAEDVADCEGHPIIVMTMAAFELGWGMVTEGSSQEHVRGLCVGTEEYLNEMFGEETGVDFVPDF